MACAKGWSEPASTEAAVESNCSSVAAGLTARLGKGGELARSASRALQWGAVLVPAGFLLGGLVIHDGDPGLGVMLVPVGALLLLYGVGRVARDLAKAE